MAIIQGPPARLAAKILPLWPKQLIDGEKRLIAEAFCAGPGAAAGVPRQAGTRFVVNP
jgi:hypothetical protein